MSNTHSKLGNRQDMRPLPWVIGLLLLVSAGCASSQSAPSVPPSVEVTGTWAGTWNPGGPGTPGGGDYILRLQQTGSAVRGEVTLPGYANFSGALEGRVAGNELSFRLLSGASGAELTVTGNEMSGYTTATGARLSLRRRQE